MFIGGLSWQTTPGRFTSNHEKTNTKTVIDFSFLENLKNYFTEFGEVAECMIMKDAITKRSR